MTIIGGENIYHSEVEGALYSRNDVKEAIVFGKANEGRGEVVTIVIATNDDLDADKLSQFLDECIAGFKRLNNYFFTDELLKSGGGKIQHQSIIDKHTKDKYAVPSATATSLIFSRKPSQPGGVPRTPRE